LYELPRKQIALEQFISASVDGNW